MKHFIACCLMLLLITPAASAQTGEPGASAESASAGAGVWTGSDEQKLFGLATIWSEAKFAFPSFSAVPELDWDLAFREFVPRVLETADQDEYYWTLMEFAALLNDGHTGVLPPWGYLKPEYDNPPIEVEVLADGFTVVEAANTDELRSQNVYAGLEILSVDGVAVGSYFDDAVNRYYPRGSAHANAALNVVYLLRGPAGTTVTLGVRDTDGTEREVTLTRDSSLGGGMPFFPRLLQWVMADPPMESTVLPGGVRYVRLSNFENPAMADQFLGLIDGLSDEQTSGLIIDLRFNLGGRSDIADPIVGALIDEPVSTPLWKYPLYVAAREAWGHEREWATDHGTVRPGDGPGYDGPVVVLTSSVTASTAEDVAIELRTAGRALLVGARTAGSAGNPRDIPLPAGGTFKIASFRALLPDGGEYVGIGVAPDVAVRPTKDDVRGGGDPVLEKALEVIGDWDSYASQER